MADNTTCYRMAASVYISGMASPHITGKVLDVGCGRKPYKRLFPACDWVGLDSRGVGDVTGEATDLPFPDGLFDTVLCTDLLHLTPTPAFVLSECARVLKPGGHLVVVARCTLDVGEHYFGISPHALGQMVLAMGLEGVDLRPEGKLIGHEWRDYLGFEKYSEMLPRTVPGWVDQMDLRYPAISCAIARKPCSNE